MSYCLNLNCPSPQNTATAKFCATCGTQLLLQSRYRALRPIGQGGFGATYQAIDEAKPSKPACVIKQFAPVGQGNLRKAAELFQQEAVRLDSLGHHAQIPALLAHFEQQERQYIVQEFIHGQNLEDELQQNGPFSEAQIRSLLLDLLPVLDFVHRQDVIHRDIKPANIIRRQSDQKLVLVDFGAAKYATGTALIRTGTTIGSAEFIAPEQGRGKATFASDLYGLGTTCLYLLTQTSPWQLYSDAENRWAWRDFLSGRTISSDLGQVLDKLIANALNQRYPSAQAALQALAGPPTQTRSTAPQSPHRSTAPSPAKPNAPKSTPTATRTALSQSPRLASEKGVDYTQLRDLLAQAAQTNDPRTWKAADQETLKVMEQALDGKKWTAWTRKDLLNFPCQDLRTIDQLWVHYSRGQFGFSVQKEIYARCGAKLDGKFPGYEIWNSFCTQVGWRVNDSYIGYSEVTFDTSGNKGHLPRLGCGECGFRGFGYVW